MSWTDNTAWDALLEADPRIAIGSGFGPADPNRRPESTEVLYRPGELLVAHTPRDAADRAVRAEIAAANPRSLRDSTDERDRRRAGIADRLGLELIQLEDRDPLGLLRDLRRSGIRTRRASLNHVFVACPQRHGGDSPPDPITDSNELLTIPPTGARDGQGVTIGVLDTGIVDPTDVQFAFGVRDSQDHDTITPPGSGPYDPGVGHGTLVAGVIARYAPGAALEIRRVLDNPGGVADELDIAADLEVFENDNFDFVNASFSGFAVDDETMLGFNAAVQKLLATGTVIIAAVGNEGVDRPTFMAAFDGVVGVASVEGEDDALQLAEYSNCGGHVKLCGRGTDVQSTYVTGQAKVSGTSFAAPKATALAAINLEKGAADARAAVDQLIDDTSRPWINRAGRFIGL
jgi:subtilisin family serine protease